ncbi:unnamed protein product [Lampetra planeri]
MAAAEAAPARWGPPPHRRGGFCVILQRSSLLFAGASLWVGRKTPRPFIRQGCGQPSAARCSPLTDAKSLPEQTPPATPLRQRSLPAEESRHVPRGVTA